MQTESVEALDSTHVGNPLPLRLHRGGSRCDFQGDRHDPQDQQNDRQHRMFEFLKRIDDHRTYILLDDKYAQWRWTKGYVENVAGAICLTVTDERAAGDRTVRLINPARTLELLEQR